jgi:hypothetical protein
MNTNFSFPRDAQSPRSSSAFTHLVFIGFIPMFYEPSYACVEHWERVGFDSGAISWLQRNRRRTRRGERAVEVESSSTLWDVFDHFVEKNRESFRRCPYLSYGFRNR